MRRMCLLTMVVGSLLGLCPSTWAESASGLLEKGIYTEETVGDLDAAIAIYKKIVEDAEANRSYVAQAHYRLGMCYLKKAKHREALAAFQRIVSDFPKQKQLVAQAREHIPEARRKLTEAERKNIVKQAVLTTSTCAEGDPRVPKALASLRDLDEKVVVTELAGYLDSDKNTVRRAAIYILLKGGFESIEPASARLRKLCSHEEALTRGMAAIALGGNKVGSSFETLCKMTLDDTDGYARRCAAYALGLLGRADAKLVLEKAIKDSDPHVRNNAESALTMLAQGGAAKGAAPAVVKTNPPALASDVSASLKTITVTFDRPMMDKSWSWTGGGKTYPKTTGGPRYDGPKTTCTLPVTLEPGKVYWVGINSKSYKNFRSADGKAAMWYVILFATEGRDGKPTPIPEKQLRRARDLNEDAKRGATPPVVVKTTPAALAKDVSPTLDKITVTFSRPMMDGSWSWTGGGKTYPKTTGKPRYDPTKTTCTLPVKLAPGKVYWVGINSKSYKNFQTPGHLSAKPYVVLFATKGRNGKPTPIPADMALKATAINSLAQGVR